ncbi:MAG: hypothetical protein ABI175_29105 [Polyangiales bacterium]
MSSQVRRWEPGTIVELRLTRTLQNLMIAVGSTLALVVVAFAVLRGAHVSMDSLPIVLGIASAGAVAVGVLLMKLVAARSTQMLTVDWADRKVHLRSRSEAQEWPFAAISGIRVGRERVAAGAQNLRTRVMVLVSLELPDRTFLVDDAYEGEGLEERARALAKALDVPLR